MASRSCCTRGGLPAAVIWTFLLAFGTTPAVLAQQTYCPDVPGFEVSLNRDVTGAEISSCQEATLSGLEQLVDQAAVDCLSNTNCRAFNLWTTASRAVACLKSESKQDAAVQGHCLYTKAVDACALYDINYIPLPSSEYGGRAFSCLTCRAACEVEVGCNYYTWGSSYVTGWYDTSACHLLEEATVATAGPSPIDCATIPGFSAINGWSHAGDDISCTAASSDSPASIATTQARACNANPSCLAFTTFPAERSGLTASCVKPFANVTQRFTNPFDSRIVGVGSGMCFYVKEGTVSSGRVRIGCYSSENLDITASVLIASGANLGQCEQVARRHGYAYFAVGNGNACYASNDLNALTFTGRVSGCSSRCPNNSSYTGGREDDICGGPSAVSLFALKYGNGDLRLTRQRSATGATLSGRLEVYSAFFGVWGTVCDDSFTEQAAAVACRQLGLSGPVATFTSTDVDGVFRSYPPVLFFYNNADIFLDDVSCTGTETSLLQCRTHAFATANDCSSVENVELTCSEPVNGAVRLAGGGTSGGLVLGRVELYSAASRTWGSVCDDVLISSTGYQEAATTCRSLGLSTAGAVFDTVPSVNAFGAVTPGGTFLDGFSCTSSATSLTQCISPPFPSPSHDCLSSEDSVVICSTEPLPIPSPIAPVPSPRPSPVAGSSPSSPAASPSPFPSPSPSPAPRPVELPPLDCPIIPRYELSIGRERVGSDIPGGCFPSHAGDGPRPIRTTVEQAAVSCDGVPPCRAFNVLVVNGTVADSCMKFSAAINSVNASFCFYKRLADSCEHNSTLSNGTSAPITIESEVSNCQLCRSVCEANSQCTTWRWANYETPSAPSDSSPCYLPEPQVRAVPADGSHPDQTRCASVPGYSLVDGYDVSGGEISCETASSSSTPAYELAQRSAIACNRQPGCLSFNTYPGGSGGVQRSCLKTSANANLRYTNPQDPLRYGEGSGLCLYVKEGALATNRRLLGCYETPNSNALFQTSRRVSSLDMCEQTARSFGTTFFAIVNGSTCYVEDELSVFTGRSRSNTCRPCTVNATETCGNGALRLTGGSYNRGRLEVYSTARGSWGSVCDRSFTAVTASVACKQLGFSDLGTSFTSAATGGSQTSLLPPLGGIVLESLTCNGGEGSLLECASTFPQPSSCTHDNDVELTCVAPADGALRLLNGPVSGTSVGRLEVYSSDRATWGTVCSDNFDDAAALVACRQLSLRTSWASYATVPRPDAFGATPPGGILLDGFTCTNTTTRLIRCASTFPTAHDCTHARDIVLYCSATPRPEVNTNTSQPSPSPSPSQSPSAPSSAGFLPAVPPGRRLGSATAAYDVLLSSKAILSGYYVNYGENNTLPVRTFVRTSSAGSATWLLATIEDSYLKMVEVTITSQATDAYAYVSAAGFVDVDTDLELNSVDRDIIRIAWNIRNEIPVATCRDCDGYGVELANLDYAIVPTCIGFQSNWSRIDLAVRDTGCNSCRLACRASEGCYYYGYRSGAVFEATDEEACSSGDTCRLYDSRDATNATVVERTISDCANCQEACRQRSSCQFFSWRSSTRSSRSTTLACAPTRCRWTDVDNNNLNLGYDRTAPCLYCGAMCTADARCSYVSWAGRPLVPLLDHSCA